MVKKDEKLKKSSIIQRIFMRKMTDQKLLLASDFFHTKAFLIFIL